MANPASVNNSGVEEFLSVCATATLVRMTHTITVLIKSIKAKVSRIVKKMFKSKKGMPESHEDDYKLIEEAFEAYRAALIAPIVLEQAMIQKRVASASGRLTTSEYLMLRFIKQELSYFRSAKYKMKHRLRAPEFDKQF